MLQTRNVYILLFSLYWAQGLPVGFMTHALPVILRAQGVSLAQIGGFGLLMLPWSVKVFWAPVLDSFGITRFGHYRSWVIPLQFLTVLVLIGLSFLPIDGLNQPIYLWAFFVGLLSMNLLGATQDIATDGLAVNILKGEQQHWGNTFQVIGSRRWWWCNLVGIRLAELAEHFFDAGCNGLYKHAADFNLSRAKASSCFRSSDHTF